MPLIVLGVILAANYLGLFGPLGLGLPEVFVIGVVAVLLFGRKLPDAGAALARWLRKLSTP